MSNPLVIGQSQIAQLARLRELASANPIDMNERVKTLRSKEGRKHHLEQMTRQSLLLPMTYMVTFTLELHNGKLMRHLSMSTTRRGKMPSPDSVWAVAELLGFEGSLQQCKVWIEDLDTDQGDGSGEDKAINVVQPVHMLPDDAAGRA